MNTILDKIFGAKNLQESHVKVELKGLQERMNQERICKKTVRKWKSKTQKVTSSFKKLD